eukprot:GHVQ01005839.1.p1 GENE.GHVQ01005839.1~~GHVQ01005839.1.p1  ORF type:complete len:494 (-),score=156.35 GHVQ01005839.1:115-1596(-)
MSGRSARLLAEQRLQKQRVQEARQGELHRYINDQQTWAAHNTSTQRVDAIRRKQEKSQIEAELRLQQELQHRHEEQIHRRETHATEQRIAAALSQAEAEAVRESNVRRRVCENSSELRELRSRLDVARANKLIAEQILEKDLRREEERIRGAALDERILEENMEEVEKRRGEEIQKEAHKRTVLLELQSQMEDKVLEQERWYKEFEKDKEEVAVVVGRIQMEDEAAAEDRLKKKREEKENLSKFLQVREEYQQQQKLREEEESKGIQTYAELKLKRETQLLEERQEQEEERKKVLSKLYKDKLKSDKKQQDTEQMLNDLYLEELEQKNIRQEEEAAEKRQNDKLAMQQAYRTQMDIKRDLQMKQAQEEEMFRQSMLTKFAEDDRLEQLSDLKRKQKIRDHKKAVEELVKVREEKYNAERIHMQAEQERTVQEEEVRVKLIEEERQRVLREEVVSQSLLKFLPKGTLRDEEDVQMIYEQSRVEGRLKKRNGQME